MKNFILLLILFLVIACSYSHGESLFNPNTTRSTSLFADPSARASQVGDLITVIIDAQTDINSTSSSKTQSERDIDITDFIPFISVPAISGSNSSGSTKTGKREFDFQSQISVIIQEVLPNGNFVVMGQQHISVGSKEQLLSFSGIVRPGDITQANTIKSSQIADVWLDIEGELGDIKEKKGILTWFMDIIF